MYILGVSAFYHDSAACLLKSGEIVAAAQEERFSRKKHDAKFPAEAIAYCLAQEGICASDLSLVTFYEKPIVKFERLLETYFAFAPRGYKNFAMAMPGWLKSKLFQKKILEEELTELLGEKNSWQERILFSEHHLSHAASAFFPSPFNRAAILTLDGVGEWTTTSVALGNGNELNISKEIRFPHSLGLLYSAFTHYTGFKVNSGEYKVMGLAPYGTPKYAGVIKNELIDISRDGSFRLNMEYFNFATALEMTNERFNRLFDGAPREQDSPPRQKEMDIAASIQQVIEEVIVLIGENIVKETGEKNLCLAGGVALNCVANGALHRKNLFEEIWIQPAAGDAGGAVGAALATWYVHHGAKRTVDSDGDRMKGALLGPDFRDKEIIEQLNSCGASFEKFEFEELIDFVSDAIAEGSAVGWMQGRMEFGPRSLGNRSILADPRSPAMQQQLNLKIKYRESFRPFAPSILAEDTEEWFELNTASPYMLFVANVHPSKRVAVPSSDGEISGIKRLNTLRSRVPAVTHVDSSARIQTVSKEMNPKFHALINKFKEKTDCPILVNTSFNVRGEPVVCSPKDAFRCFMGTELDILVVGNFVLLKKKQDSSLKLDYTNFYERD